MTTTTKRGRGTTLALLLATLFLVGAAFAAGWVGFWAAQRLALPLPLPGLATSDAPAAPETVATPAAAGDLAVLWEALGLLNENFYDQAALPGGDDVTYAAIEGVVDATGDPHTGFMDPERSEIVQSSLEGEFEGIGAVVEMADEGLVVVTPYEGSPAAVAGLLSGDIVVAVDGQSTVGMTVDEAVSLVRGPKGTVVNLTVRREGEAEPLAFAITRDRIVIPVVEARMIEAEGTPRIGYIRLYDFGGRSSEEFRAALQGLLDQGAERLIVDLRNNPGGYLQASVEITSQFIGEGLILSEKGSNGRDIEHRAEGGGIALTIPLAVLINEGSASASEIFAGAIRDTGRGTLIGTTSFGKGSVQVTRDLSDGSSMRITVARWFTPSGSAIHEVGIEPDQRIELPDDLQPGQDPQLDAAVQFLRGQ